MTDKQFEKIVSLLETIIKKLDGIEHSTSGCFDTDTNTEKTCKLLEEIKNKLT